MLDKPKAPDFQTAARALTPELISRFRQALELGRWPDGRVLTSEQKALLLESVLLAESEQGIPETERTGYIDRSRPPKAAPGGESVIHKE